MNETGYSIYSLCLVFIGGVFFATGLIGMLDRYAHRSERPTPEE